jgi:conserved domain protein
LYAIKDDYDRLNKADEYCHRGLSRFCLNLGFCYAAPKGERNDLQACFFTKEKPVPQSQKAIKYFKKYYELNPFEPPSALGEELIFDGQCKDGLKILRDYCDKKDDQSCFLLGYAYLSGQCVRYSTKEAKRLFGLACDYGFQGGCTEYKRMSK